VRSREFMISFLDFSIHFDRYASNSLPCITASLVNLDLCGVESDLFGVENLLTFEFVLMDRNLTTFEDSKYREVRTKPVLIRLVLYP
jgi:hypothetical protein